MIYGEVVGVVHGLIIVSLIYLVPTLYMRPFANIVCNFLRSGDEKCGAAVRFATVTLAVSLLAVIQRVLTWLLCERVGQNPHTRLKRVMSSYKNGTLRFPYESSDTPVSSDTEDLRYDDETQDSTEEVDEAFHREREMRSEERRKSMQYRRKQSL